MFTQDFTNIVQPCHLLIAKFKLNVLKIGFDIMSITSLTQYVSLILIKKRLLISRCFIYVSLYFVLNNISVSCLCMGFEVLKKNKTISVSVLLCVPEPNLISKIN